MWFAKWFEWIFGAILMSAITVITSLNYLTGFSRIALIIGLIIYLVASLVVQFDNPGRYKAKD